MLTSSLTPSFVRASRSTGRTGRFSSCRITHPVIHGVGKMLVRIGCWLAIGILLNHGPAQGTDSSVDVKRLIQQRRAFMAELGVTLRAAWEKVDSGDLAILDSEAQRIAEYASQISEFFPPGSFGKGSRARATIADPAVRSILSRVSASMDPGDETRYPAEWPSGIRLTLANGRMLSTAVNHPKGDPENPITPSELTNKFRQLAAYAGHGAQAENLIRWVTSLVTERPVAYGLIS